MKSEIALAITLLTFLFAVLLPRQSLALSLRSSGPPKPVPAREINVIIKEINAYRAQFGLPPVKINTNVCTFAKTRVTEITADFSHTGFNNRIAQHSLPYHSYSLVTENLAKTSKASEVVDLWINSPVHAANMRKNTPFVCVERAGDYFAYEGWRP